MLTTFLFFAVVASFIIAAEQKSEMPLYVTISSDGHNKRVSCWDNGNNEIYIFLPAYTQQQNVQLWLNTDNPVEIDGINVTNGLNCNMFKLNKPYVLRYTSWGKTLNYTISFLQSSNIPALFLETESGDMDYIHMEKGNEESGRATLFTSEGALDYAGNMKSLCGRGNATWTDYEKKPYSIELETDADLLGMGAAQDWILLANAADPSNMRNKIVYDFAAAIGLPYSPECRWLDLYLNGEYAGLYLLCEKNEVHSERVDITQSGSFLVSLDTENRLMAKNDPYIVTENLQALRVHYPKTMSDAEFADLINFWQSAENAIMVEDGMDPISGKALQEIIDVDSWVLNYLIDEVFGNLDGFLASRFFYYDNGSDQKIHAGPVWDYDKAMGNDTDSAWSITDPNVLIVNRYHCGSVKTTNWAEQLYERSWFKDSLKGSFTEVIVPAIEEVVNTKISVYADVIRCSAQMNGIRWMLTDSESLDVEVSHIVSYLEGHMAFLQKVWLDEAELHQVCFSGIENDVFYSISDGGYLREIPVVQDTENSVFLGWYYAETDEFFDITQPITEDIEIYAKWEDSSSKLLGQIGKLMPLGIIAVMGVVFLVIDIKRTKKSR